MSVGDEPVADGKVDDESMGERSDRTRGEVEPAAIETEVEKDWELDEKGELEEDQEPPPFLD